MESVIVSEERHTTLAKPLRQEFQDLAALNRELSHLENRLNNIPDDHSARLRLIKAQMKDNDYNKALNNIAYLREKKYQPEVIAKLEVQCTAKVQSGAQKAKDTSAAPIMTR